MRRTEKIFSVNVTTARLTRFLRQVTLWRARRELLRENATAVKLSFARINLIVMKGGMQLNAKRKRQRNASKGKTVKFYKK